MNDGRPRWLYPVPDGNDSGFSIDNEDLLENVDICATMYMPLKAIEPDDLLPKYSVKAIYTSFDEDINPIQKTEIAWASVIFLDPFDMDIDLMDSCDAYSGDLLDFYSTVYGENEESNEMIPDLFEGKTCLLDEFIIHEEVWNGRVFLEWIIKYIAGSVDAIFVLPMPSVLVDKGAIREINRIEEPDAVARLRLFYAACGFYPWGSSQYMYRIID